MNKYVSARGRALARLAAAALLLAALVSSGCFPVSQVFDEAPEIFWGNVAPTEAPEIIWGNGALTEAPEEPELTYAPGVPPELEFVVEDSGEPLTIDTYTDDALVGKRALCIYDADYLDLFFDYPSVSAEECISHIGENGLIPEKFKALLREYVSSFAAKYPEADLRPFDFNIRTIEIVECDEFELALHTLSFDAYGCYVRTENKIYVPKDYNYVPGTWEYQVIMHEFSHAARTVTRNSGDLDLTIDLCSPCVIPDEALNSIFTVSLFDYEERDIAYQLQSNMFLILTECLDGYSLSDYINHSLSYFAHMLDEQNGNNNYAMSIMMLIDEQRGDWANDEYERDQEIYHPIYDYLAKMYVDKYASPGMSEAELTLLIDELVERVMYDVPDEYHVDTDEFYRFAKDYYAVSSGAADP